MIPKEDIDKLKRNSESKLLEMLDAGQFDQDIQDRQSFFVTACDIAPESFSIAFIDKYDGIDLNAESIWGETALLNAVDTGKLELCKYLLEKGADPNIKNSADCTALVLSCSSYNKGIARELIKHGADVDIMGRDGTALMEAVRKGDLGMMELLLENNADINITCSNNISPLYLAVSDGSFERMLLLLKYNPDPNIINNLSWLSAAGLAEVSNYEDIKAIMLEYVDKFKSQKIKEAFEREKLIINKAKNIVKSAKIPTIKNVRKI